MLAPAKKRINAMKKYLIVVLLAVVSNIAWSNEEVDVSEVCMQEIIDNEITEDMKETYLQECIDSFSTSGDQYTEVEIENVIDIEQY